MYSTGTCVKKYFRLFVVSFKKFQNYVLFYQEPELEPAPGRKFPGAGAAFKKSRPRNPGANTTFWTSEH